MQSPTDSSYDPGNWRIALLTAFLATFVFFYPALSKLGMEADFALRGDTINASIAGFLLTKFYTQHGIFAAIDFFTHGGASEYFLRPNFPVYYPPLLLTTPLLSPDTPETMTGFYVAFEAFHALVSAFFLHRLCTRFLRFDLLVTLFVVLGYTFSQPMACSLWFLSLVICAWLLPVCIYAGFAYRQQRGWHRLVFTSIPMLFAYTAGYFPAALATLVLSQGFLFFWLWKEEGCPFTRQRWRVQWAFLLPALLATAVVAPLYLAASIYHQSVEISASPYNTALLPVANDLAEQARFLVRGLTDTLKFPGSFYELSLFWGLVPILIGVVYFAQLPASASLLRLARERGVDHKLLCASLGFYGLAVFAIFGISSPLAHLFYYFVPVLGGMHIYQRFLVGSHLFFILAIAMMLRFIVWDERRQVAKILLAVMGSLTLVATQLVGASIGHSAPLSDGTIVELLLALAFLVGLLLLSRKGALIVAALSCFAVSLGAMYRYTDHTGQHYAEIQQENIAFNRNNALYLANWLRAHSKRPIIKYIDLVPNWHPYLPKNLPWFLLSDMKLASYSGYDPHLGADYNFRRLMPSGPDAKSGDMVMRPDWEWLRQTEAEFVIFQEGHLANDPALATYADLSSSAIYRFQGVNLNSKGNYEPATFVVAPLRFPAVEIDPILFDNGFLRVIGPDDKAKIGSFSSNYANKLQLQLTVSRPVRIQYLFWPGAHLKASVDGHTVSPAMVNGLLTIVVPQGSHEIRIVYRNNLLDLFLGFFALYGGVVAAALLRWLWRPSMLIKRFCRQILIRLQMVR